MSGTLDIFESNKVRCACVGCDTQVPKPSEDDTYPPYCSRKCEVKMQKMLAAQKNTVKKNSQCRTGDMDFLSLEGLPLPGDRRIPGW